MEESLIEEGYFYLTASHRRKPDLIEEYPRMLMERSVEGFILIDTVLSTASRSRRSRSPGIARFRESPTWCSTSAGRQN